ncbi:MAG: type IV pilus twitching motility protein PilT [Lachnospiraceae bacterium]|nr:type IV pilus twitching motility protein PilT [Lachnospiraceae bacterium]
MNLTDIMEYAIENRASDIHFTVGKPVIIRVDGELIETETAVLKKADVEELAFPLFKNNARLSEEFDQNGEIDFASTLEGEGRFRVNVFHQRGAVSMVMRILPIAIPAPEELGLPESVKEFCHLKRGLVLVTGATGTGKSTTLASLINLINKNYKEHIITLEDPIEYIHTHDKSIVNQRELGSDTVSYANALRAALRQDPDVILVGEMRDLETIATAITAAETGHLVFSTLHTNSAAATIDRIVDVFPPHQQQQIRVQLANVLEGVISQQLIHRDGAHGRVAAFEVMMANPAIRNLIRENKTYQIPSQIQTHKKMGMQTMDDALFEHYLAGRITTEDCLHYAQDFQAMAKRISF